MSKSELLVDQNNSIAVENTVVGIGVLLLLSRFTELPPDIDDVEVFVGKQKEAKATTAKKVGEMSLIQETMQGDLHAGEIVPESSEETLQRALGEVVNDENLKDAKGHFHHVIFDRAVELPLESLPIPASSGRLEVVVYTGKDHTQFIPDSAEEVYPATSERLGTILKDPNLRPMSREFLTYAKSSGLLPRAMELYAQGRTEPVFPEEFSFADANRRWRKTVEMPQLLQMQQIANR